VDSVKSRMATGYNPDGSEDQLFNLGWAAPAGQMYSTVNDLMKVCTVYYMCLLYAVYQCQPEKLQLLLYN